MGRRARGARKIKCEYAAAVVSAAITALVTNKAARRTVASTASAVIRALRFDGGGKEDLSGSGKATSRTLTEAMEVDQADKVQGAVVANVEKKGNKKVERVRLKRQRARARKREAKAAKFAEVQESAAASDAIMEYRGPDTDMVPAIEVVPSHDAPSGSHVSGSSIPGLAELQQQLKEAECFFEAVKADFNLLIEARIGRWGTFTSEQEALYQEKQDKLEFLEGEKRRLQAELEEAKSAPVVKKYRKKK